MNKNLKVGIFVAIGLLIIAVGLLALGAGAIFKTTISAETYIDESVQGLDVGSLVKQRGVTIGKVSRIDFVHNIYPVVASDPDFERDNRLVLVEMEINPKIFHGASATEIDTRLQQAVAAGLRIRMAAQGLTGGSYLEMDYITQAAPPMAVSWTPRSYYVPSSSSTIALLTSSGEEILRNLRHADIAGMVAAATALIQELRGAAGSIQVLLNPTDMAEMRTDLKATIKGAHEVITNTATNLAPTLADLRRSSAELADITATLNKSLSSGDLNHTLAQANAITANLQQLTARLPETLNLVDGTIKRLDTVTLSGQDDLAAMLANLNATSQNLRELTENAKRYPSQVLFGEPPAPHPGDHP